MPDFPLLYRPINSPVISFFSPECIGQVVQPDSGAASAIWTTANLAYFIPFLVYHPITIKKMAVYNGTVVSGNVDMGIYDVGGKRMGSTGSTAQAGTSVLQTIDLTDIDLNPGLYLKALAVDNITATFFRASASIGVGDLRCAGMFQMASAFPLPDPAVFAAQAAAYVPIFAASRRDTI